MKKAILIPLLACALTMHAQTNEDNEVIEVISRLFDGMKRFDTTAIRKTLHPDARLQTVVVGKGNKTLLKTESLNAFLAQIASLRSDTLVMEEKVLSYEVKMDGAMASVWAPYEFYMNKKKLHSGVDAFQLFRSSTDGWQIIQICDTRRKK